MRKKIYAAAVTPFTDRDEIDVVSMLNILKRVKSSGWLVGDGLLHGLPQIGEVVKIFGDDGQHGAAEAGELGFQGRQPGAALAELDQIPGAQGEMPRPCHLRTGRHPNTPQS